MNDIQAYFLGAYLGDGNLWNDKKGWHPRIIMVSLDKDVIEKFAYCGSVLFECASKVKPYYSKPHLWMVRLYTKKGEKFLRKYTGNQKSWLFKPKEWMLSAQHEFVSGLMDTDGYISQSFTRHNDPRWTLGFVNSAQWLPNFKSLLQSLGVICGKTTLKNKYRSKLEKDCYQLHINLLSYVAAGLYFSCKRKQRRLEAYISRQNILGRLST